MKQVTTYLTFNGNCREAMTFYSECLGAQLHVFTFADAPPEFRGDKDRIMHASINKAGVPVLMASDTMPGTPLTVGTNFSVSVACESVEEAERLFQQLSDGGTVTMALQDTFWGARFGMLTDRFGINWMFNFEHPRSA